MGRWGRAGVRALRRLLRGPTAAGHGHCALRERWERDDRERPGRYGRRRPPAEHGWARGSDGVLVHQTGERFETIFSIRPTTGADKDATIVADGWKALGLQIGLYFIPPAQADDRQVLSTQPFMNLSSNGAAGF